MGLSAIGLLPTNLIPTTCTGSFKRGLVAHLSLGDADLPNPKMPFPECSVWARREDISTGYVSNSVSQKDQRRQGPRCLCHPPVR